MHGLQLLLFIKPLKRCTFIGRCVLDNDRQRIALGETFRQWDGQRATHNLMVIS